MTNTNDDHVEATSSLIRHPQEEMGRYATPEMQLRANASPGYVMFTIVMVPLLLLVALVVGPPLLYTSNDPSIQFRVHNLDWQGVVLKEITSYRTVAGLGPGPGPSSSNTLEEQSQSKLPLHDIVILVTGATSGIGEGLVKWTYSQGATIIAVGRSQAKLLVLQNQLEDSDPSSSSSSSSSSPPRFFAVVADIIDLRSVALAADAMIEAAKTSTPSNAYGGGENDEDATTKSASFVPRFPTILMNDEQLFPKKIDVLVNNAGMHLGPEALWNMEPKSVQGYDLVFAVNYLSHFLFTEKLVPTLLAASSQPRVVQVTSSFHFAVDGSDLFPTKSVTREEAYCTRGGGRGTDENENDVGVDEEEDEFATGVCTSVSTTGLAPVASIPGGSHGFYMYMGQRQYANSKLAQILHARYLNNKYDKQRRSSSSSSSTNNNITFRSACPAWVGTSILRVKEDSLPGKAFRALAFEMEGFGLSSILRAMFTTTTIEEVEVEGTQQQQQLPPTDDDYYISTGFFHYGKLLDEYLLKHTALTGSKRHSELIPTTWSYSWFPVRDFGGYIMGILILPWQRIWPVLETTQSSLASYDGQLQQELYEWSYEAVKEWL